jgi:hypothetical protein
MDVVTTFLLPRVTVTSHKQKKNGKKNEEVKKQETRKRSLLQEEEQEQSPTQYTFPGLTVHAQEPWAFTVGENEACRL